MLEIKFDEENKPLAAAIGQALLTYSDTIAAMGQTATAIGLMAAEAATIGTMAAKAATNEDADNIEELAGQELKTSEPADTAAGGSTSTGYPETAGTSATGDTAELDEKGVNFDARYCGVAKVPFYASGKTKGQWKKKQGVSQDEYDEWYATELLGSNIVEETADPEPIETAAAFGGQVVNDKPAAAPKDAGELMGWVSEQQTAERLTPADVQEAYTLAGVAVQDLFDTAKSADAVKAVYGVLSAKVGA